MRAPSLELTLSPHLSEDPGVIVGREGDWCLFAEPRKAVEEVSRMLGYRVRLGQAVIVGLCIIAAAWICTANTRYQISALDGGGVFRVDRQTGEVQYMTLGYLTKTGNTKY